MITAELRSIIVELSIAETLSGLSLEKFDKILPLPIWREIKGEELHYGCSIASLLATQNHIDEDLLATHWRAKILRNRGQILLGTDHLPQAKSLEAAPLNLAQTSSFTANTRLKQDGPLLYWVLSKAELCRWLTLNVERLATQAGSMESNLMACGLAASPQKFTAKREFAWYHSHNNCLRLAALLAKAVEPSALPTQQKSAHRDFSSALESLQREDSRLFPEGNWHRLLPLVAAQLELIDVMVLAPQRLVPATDHLSKAWSQWLKIQVWNNLRLSQIAEKRIIADVVYITQALLCLSARACFDANWARPCCSTF